MISSGSQPPVVDEKFYCRHPFEESLRCLVKPTTVIKLHELVWDKGKVVAPLPTIHEIKEYTKNQVRQLRNDHKRELNPTPYKVSLSSELYEAFHLLWLKESPIEIME